MDWTPVVFAAGSVALVVWALVGLRISTFRRDHPPSEDPRAHSTPPPPVLEILELLRELVPSAGERERLWARVDALERRASVHVLDHQALDKRFTALADRANALDLAVKALRERVEERGESSDEDPRPSELAWRALTLLQREIELEEKAHAVTDNRHPATENDPGRGSANHEKP